MKSHPRGSKGSQLALLLAAEGRRTALLRSQRGEQRSESRRFASQAVDSRGDPCCQELQLQLQCRWTLYRWIAPISRCVGHGGWRTHGHKSCNQGQLRKALPEGPRSPRHGNRSRRSRAFSPGFFRAKPHKSSKLAAVSPDRTRAKIHDSAAAPPVARTPRAGPAGWTSLKTAPRSTGNEEEWPLRQEDLRKQDGPGCRDGLESTELWSLEPRSPEQSRLRQWSLEHWSLEHWRLEHGSLEH